MKRRNSHNIVKWFLITWIVYLGALGTILNIRINGDGVSYLEIAQFYLKGDFAAAINAYWSPLYSWVIALFLAALRPFPSREYLTVEIANLFVFFLTFFCFLFLLKNINLFRRLHGIRFSKNESRNKSILDIVGICLFAWMVTEWIPVRLVTPDLCVAAFVFLATGLFLKITTAPTDKGSVSFLFGMALGGGYLAKAVMFPLSFVFFLLSLFIGGNRRQITRRSFFILAGFCLLALPWILTLSYSKGRVTFGDTGKLNYVWAVSGRGVHSRNWQGGRPVHLTRMLNANPPVFEFASPVPGTYPPWFDPSYWNEGASTNFDFQRQLKCLRGSLSKYIDIAWRMSVGWSFPLCLLLFWAICRDPHQLGRNMGLFWPMLAFSAAAFGIYTFVHVELRFLGAFAVLMLLCLFSSMDTRDGPVERRVFLVIFLLALFAGPFHAPYLDQKLIPESKALFSGQVQSDPYHELADLLSANGIHGGQKIAIIGGGALIAVWAHRARVRIIAEIPWLKRAQFWNADKETRKHVMEIFSKLNVAAVVAFSPTVHKNLDKEGWIKAKEAGIYMSIPPTRPTYSSVR